MDKKMFRLLKYIASVPYRSQKEVETFLELPLTDSLELIHLLDEHFISVSNDKQSLFVTPQGRELMETRAREWRRDLVAYGTFVVVSLTFLLKLFGYF